MWQEPNCSMDWHIYLDWLYEFNNNDDLREINCFNLHGINDYLIYIDYHADCYYTCHALGSGSFEELDSHLDYLHLENTLYGTPIFGSFNANDYPYLTALEEQGCGMSYL